MSTSDIAWIGTVQGSLVLIVGIISGPLFDRGLLKLIMIPASMGLVVSMMMLSLSTEYYQLMLCQGFLFGICGGGLRAEKSH